MIWAAATRLISREDGDAEEDAVERDNLVKRTLGLADTGIPIGRKTEPAGYFRWKSEPNDATASGQVTPPKGEALDWREFVWQGPATIDECEWGAVRWRFYSNGLVCFDARMANTSSKLDNGDVQGHRIELREVNGLLLGVWIAGFFVRRSLPQRGFATSVEDSHAPLQLHFNEIAESQSGAWLCI